MNTDAQPDGMDNGTPDEAAIARVMARHAAFTAKAGRLIAARTGYDIPGLEAEDCAQLLRLKEHRALRAWKPGKASLATWGFLALRNGIAVLNKRAGRIRRLRESLIDTWTPDVDDAEDPSVKDPMAQIPASDINTPDREALRVAVQAAVETLDGTNRTVAEAIMDAPTLRTAARKLGMSHSTLIEVALPRLRALFVELGFEPTSQR